MITAEFALARKLALVVLFLSIVFPTALQFEKMLILVVILVCVVLDSLKYPKKKRYWSGSIFFGLFFCCLGFFGSFHGLMRGNPGALRVLTVMAMYPLLFSIITCLFLPGDLLKIKKFFLVTGAALVGVQNAYLASSFGFDGGFVYNIMQALYGDVAVANQGEDFLLFTLPNVSSLVFMIPFFLSLGLLDARKNWKALMLALVMMLVAILTGRRAIYLSLGVSIFILLSFVAFFYGRSVNLLLKKIGLVVGLFLVVLGMAYFFELVRFDMIQNDLASIFDFKGDDSNLERRYQFDALISGFFDHPALGSGAGAAASYSRSYEQPWAYELFYVAMLFQYGLVGFLIYMLAVIYLIVEVARIAVGFSWGDGRLFSILALMAGMVSFLVANASNPYLGKFDYMWVLFLPAALVNCKKLYGGV